MDDTCAICCLINSQPDSIFWDSSDPRFLVVEVSSVSDAAHESVDNLASTKTLSEEVKIKADVRVLSRVKLGVFLLCHC